METQARSKIRAWMHRPRGSLGLIVAIFAVLAVFAAYRALSPNWRLPMQHPLVVLALLALCVALGWVVQRGVKRTVAKTIFNGHATGWQARLAFLRSVTQESNVLLGLLLFLALLAGGTLWLAGRSVDRIVENCTDSLQARVNTLEDEKLTALVGKPVCTCLAQTFLDRNGVIRLALFETPMREVSAYKALTADDEQRCLEQFDLLPEEARVTVP